MDSNRIIPQPYPRMMGGNIAMYESAPTPMQKGGKRRKQSRRGKQSKRRRQSRRRR